MRVFYHNMLKIMECFSLSCWWSGGLGCSVSLWQIKGGGNRQKNFFRMVCFKNLRGCYHLASPSSLMSRFNYEVSPSMGSLQDEGVTETLSYVVLLVAVINAI